MKAIIICAGQATRWHGDNPKHFVTVDGEPILKRTVRLLKKRGIRPSIVANDATYKLPGTQLFMPNHDLNNMGVDKFLNSRRLWSKKDRTVIFYGDVYFSDEAMETILNYDIRDWCLFARKEGSEITGSEYGECFAFSLYPEHLEKFQQALEEVARLHREDHISRSGGWEAYRQMAGYPNTRPRVHVAGHNYYEINDWTDDFDKLEEYEEFTRRRGNNSIAILIPTLGRAEKLSKVLKNASQTKIAHRVYFIIESTDEQSYKTLKDLDCEIVSGEFGTYAKAINAAFPKTKERFVFIGADDLEFDPHWAERALELMNEDTKVVGTNDLHHPQVLEGTHATHYLVDRKYIEEVGGTMEENQGQVLHEYDHNYVDTEFVQTARCRGVYDHAHKSIVKHNHHSWGANQIDATYRKGGRKHEKDFQTYLSRMPVWEEKYGRPR